jgi:hypothetical protein
MGDVTHLEEVRKASNISSEGKRPFWRWYGYVGFKNIVCERVGRTHVAQDRFQ